MTAALHANYSAQLLLQGTSLGLAQGEIAAIAQGAHLNLRQTVGLLAGFGIQRGAGRPVAQRDGATQSKRAGA